MTNSQEKLLSKLNKLLALSKSKANEHEAMVAAKQLHALLAKHNISMTSLSETDKPDIGQDYATVSASRTWVHSLATAIAKLYFCRAIKDDNQYMFVGTLANRVFAINIFEMVKKTIDTEARKASKKLYGKCVSSYITDFCMGAVFRVSERCQELIRTAKEGSACDESGEKLPVMASVYDQADHDNKDYMSRKLNVTFSRSRRRRVGGGYGAGKEAGNNIGLSRSIGANNGQRAIAHK